MSTGYELWYQKLESHNIGRIFNIMGYVFEARTKKLLIYLHSNNTDPSINQPHYSSYLCQSLLCCKKKTKTQNETSR